MVKEIKIHQKQQSGAGSQHAVFPYHRYQDKILKTKMGDIQFYRDNPQYINSAKMDSNEMEIFQKYPDLFAKVYKYTDRYAVIEKLNTDHFKQDVEKLAQGMFDFVLNDPRLAQAIIPYTIDPSNSDPSDIGVTQILWSMMVKPNAERNFQILEKYLDKQILRKFLDFLTKVEHKLIGKVRKSVDVHDGNFGYNKKGELRLLDI